MSVKETVSEVVDDSSLVTTHWLPQIAALALIVVELSWVLPWYQSLMQGILPVVPGRALYLFTGLMLLSYVLGQALSYFRLMIGLQRGILILVFAAWILLGEGLLLNRSGGNLLGTLVNLDLGATLLVITGLWLWWRAISLSRDTVDPSTVWHRFRFGLVLIIAHVLYIARFTNQAASFGPFVVFLFASLLAMVAARVAYVSSYYGARRSPFNRRWLAITLVTLFLLVGAGTVISSLLTGQFRFLLDVLATVFEWLSLPFILVATGLAYLIYYTGVVLSYLLGPVLPFFVEVFSKVTPPPNQTQATPYPGQEATAPGAERVFVSLQVILFWVLIAVFLLVLISFVRNRVLQHRRLGLQDPDSLLEGESLLDLVRQRLRDQMKKMMEGLVNVAHLRGAERQLAAARIRRIYAELMELFLEVKHPRKEYQTPLEFLPVMRSQMPFLGPELVLITEAYIKVRYGDYPETQEELYTMEEAWHRIQVEGEKLKKIVRQVDLAEEVLESQRKSEVQPSNKEGMR